MTGDLEWPPGLDYLRSDGWEVFFGVWGVTPLGECACPRGAMRSSNRDRSVGSRGSCGSVGKHPFYLAGKPGAGGGGGEGFGFPRGWRSAVSWWEWCRMAPLVRELGGRLAVAVPSSVWVLDVDSGIAWNGLVALVRSGAVREQDCLAAARTVRGWHLWIRAERPGWTSGTAQRALNSTLAGLGAPLGLEVKSGHGYVVVRDWVPLDVFKCRLGYACGVGRTGAGVAAVPVASGFPPPDVDPPEARAAVSAEQWEMWSEQERTEYAGITRSVLALAVGELQRVSVGNRNNRLNALAWYAGRQAIGAGLPYAEVFRMLVAAGVGAGLDAGEVTATVRSGLRGLET